MRRQKEIREKTENNKITPPTQTSFRKEIDTIENIYVLNYLVNIELERKEGRMVALFVDLKAAFDIVDRRISEINEE